MYKFDAGYHYGLFIQLLETKIILRANCTGYSSKDKVVSVVKDYSNVVINYLLKLKSKTQYKYINSKSKYSKLSQFQLIIVTVGNSSKSKYY